MSRFFLGRPIFAWVIAIVIMLAGILSITRLPVSQYPQIAPPQVTITATYPGASAETIENTITQQVEQAMTGLDGYLYMASNSDSSGRVSIDITFEAGTDPDIAQVQVQNRLKTVENSLPQVVQQLGVNVDKSAANFLMVVGFVDKNGKMSSADLSDYLVNNVQEPLSRITGVGEVEVFGSSYSMRIWLDPEKLHKYSLSTDEIVAAIEEQNVQVSSGAIGNLPSSTRYELNATINSMSLLETVADFENIMVKTSMDGSRVLMKDVARIEMGQESYNVIALYNGRESTGMAISLASGANAMATSDRVKERLNEMQVNFPDGMEWVVPFDTTPFVRISIQEVVRTLFEAIVLVVCVMFLFLQNWRATLIPTIAVPVVLLGTFGVLQAMGYSINVLTMFAMVLAIGLLVDDAIVVVENVERVMRTEGLSPREATEKSMGQIQGALVGIAMVLAAVFVPMAFFGGSTGIIYRQFSVTIVSAMVLSVLVALILIFTFKAAIIPVILIVIIQGSVYINMIFPYLMGEQIVFIGYMLVSSILLGATIDYAILLTTRYMEHRKSMNKYDAVQHALADSARTLITSAGILASVGAAVMLVSSLPATQVIGGAVLRGGICAFVMVMIPLPQLLILLDKAIMYTTWKGKYNMVDNKSALTAPEIAEPSVDPSAAEKVKSGRKKYREMTKEEREEAIISNILHAVDDPDFNPDDDDTE